MAVHEKKLDKRTLSSICKWPAEKTFIGNEYVESLEGLMNSKQKTLYCQNPFGIVFYGNSANKIEQYTNQVFSTILN
jgi:hypothetical protein